VNQVSTPNQLEKRWQKLCKDIAEEARRQGAVEPLIFASEAGLCVIDSAGLGSRRRSRMIATPRKTDKGWLVIFDCGHWKFMASKPRDYPWGLCNECPGKTRVKAHHQ